MNEDKSLTETCKTTIYQRENLVDKIQFLFPQYYGDIALSDFKAVLKYVDQGNVAHSEILEKDEELYKDHLRYVLPVDTDITKFAGDIKLRISFIKIDVSTKRQYVMHTGELQFHVAPLDDYYKFAIDENLESIDKLIGDLTAKIEATDKIADIYNKTKADNITYQNNKIQLSANGEKIGDAITIQYDEGTIVDGVPVTEFNNLSKNNKDVTDISNENTEENWKVIEF